jgi:predicted MFS family arabinose efflux permease
VPPCRTSAIRRPATAFDGFVVGGAVFSVADLVSSLTIELGILDAEAAQLLTVFGLPCAMALPFIKRVDRCRLLPIGLAALTIGNGPYIFAGTFSCSSPQQLCTGRRGRRGPAVDRLFLAGGAVSRHRADRGGRRHRRWLC